MDMKPKKTSWGAVANWYDDLIEESADSYQKNVILPNLIRIANPKPGMAILDVGCGQGYFSRSLAAHGANVVGTDISKELIDLARKEKRANSPTYHVSSADKLEFSQDGSFDLAVIVLALQNIENLSGTVNECVRVLKTGGRLILVMNHPAFRIPQASSWDWDQTAQKQYRRVDAYMSERSSVIDMTPGETEKNKKKFTISFHRPLQSYFKAFGKAGLAVIRLEEWISHRHSQPGRHAQEENRIRKEIPLFICLELKKF